MRRDAGKTRLGRLNSSGGTCATRERAGIPIKMEGGNVTCAHRRIEGSVRIGNTISDVTDQVRALGFTHLRQVILDPTSNVLGGSNRKETGDKKNFHCRSKWIVPTFFFCIHLFIYVI